MKTLVPLFQLLVVGIITGKSEFLFSGVFITVKYIISKNGKAF